MTGKMKYIVIIGDGMADFPLDELGGKTPLMAANKPYMDIRAGGSEGQCGDDGLGFVGVAFREVRLLGHLVQGEAGDATDVVDGNLAAWRGGGDR